MDHRNLMAGPPPTYLPDDPSAADLGSGADPAAVAAANPASLAAWVALAEQALDRGEWIAAYAYARTGYHRGPRPAAPGRLEGHGPIPWEHEPNRGFLRSLYALSRAAGAIGETEEEARCQIFLADSSAAAVAALDVS